MTTDFRALCAKVLAYNEGQGAYNFSHLNAYDRDNAAFDAWQEIKAELKSALAEPEPDGARFRPASLSPDALKQWDKAEAAISASMARVRKLAAPARAALSEPEPEGPTDEEIDDWRTRCADLTLVGEVDYYWAFDLPSDTVADIARAVLAHWGRPS